MTALDAVTRGNTAADLSTGNVSGTADELVNAASILMQVDYEKCAATLLRWHYARVELINYGKYGLMIHGDAGHAKARTAAAVR